VQIEYLIPDTVDLLYRYLDAEARVKKLLAALEKVKEDVGAQVKREEEAK
jgi:hypothetical protein